MGRCYTGATSRPARRAVHPKRRPGGGAASVHGKGEFGRVNDYEILLLLDPELEEARGDEILQRLRERVDGDGGGWDGHEPWGRRRLAYEIDHKAEAVYHLLLFKAEPATLHEVSRVLKITDGVVRHLAVRRVKDGQRTAPPQPPSPLAAAAATPAPAAMPAPAAPAPAPEPAATEPSETADDAVEVTE